MQKKYLDDRYFLIVPIYIESDTQDTRYSSSGGYNEFNYEFDSFSFPILQKNFFMKLGTDPMNFCNFIASRINIFTVPVEKYMINFNTRTTHL